MLVHGVGLSLLATIGKNVLWPMDGSCGRQKCVGVLGTTHARATYSALTTLLGCPVRAHTYGFDCRPGAPDLDPPDKLLLWKAGSETIPVMGFGTLFLENEVSRIL